MCLRDVLCACSRDFEEMAIAVTLNSNIGCLQLHLNTHDSIITSCERSIYTGMLSSCVRRLVITGTPSQIPACASAAVSRTVTTHAFSHRRSHQRRHSSSKPSNPADGSKGVAEGQAVPAGPAQSRPDSEKKSTGRSNRRKAKDVAASCTVKARDETMQNLPSVPSTHHIKGKGTFYVHMQLYARFANLEDRNCRISFLLPLSSYIRHLKLPKSCYRRCFRCNIYPTYEGEFENVQYHLNPIEYRHQARSGCTTRTLEC